jgi:hypothetical protein
MSARPFYNSTPKPIRNVALEIFADMVYIRTMKPIAFAEKERFLKELFSVLEEMF